MPAYPPPIRDADFHAVETVPEASLKQHFGSFIRQIHGFLNDLPCLRDLQTARRRWTRPRESDAFGTFETDGQHWYSFNHGGRNEAQFNIGLYGSHFRVGVGFEFTNREHGDPTLVGLTYACFNRVVSQSAGFRNFVDENRIEVEWIGARSKQSQIVPTSSVADWIPNPPEKPAWLLVGRLLRRKDDAPILESPTALGATIEAVFCGFRPLWERTQLLAATP